MSAHELREVGQLLLGIESVEACDVVDGADGAAVLEVTLWGGVVPSEVLGVLAGRGVAIDPDATATRGDPTHTRLVVRA
jgi:hypothetical protein